MPRGKYVNHKGRSRHFTAPEELQKQNDESSDDGTSEEEEEEGATGGMAKPKKTRAKKKESSTESGSDEDSEEDRDCKKGVAGLIEIENPNRQIKKTTAKLKAVDIDEAPVLLPSDKKLIAKQEARKRYEKLHAEGKTHQAKADLARLAVIRQQREEAAAKRDAEKKASEERKSTTKLLP